MLFCSSNVIIHAQLIVKSIEFLADTLAHDGNLAVFTIVLNAILENEVEVVEEVLELQVLIRVQLVFYSAEVHWLLDYVIVIGDV